MDKQVYCAIICDVIPNAQHMATKNQMVFFFVSLISCSVVQLNNRAEYKNYSAQWIEPANMWIDHLEQRSNWTACSREE